MTVSYEEVRALVKAGTRVLHIASFEWERVRGWCIALARDLALPLELWSSSSGLQHHRGDAWETELGESEPITVMARLREAEHGGVLLLEDIHPYLESQHHQVTRYVREMARGKSEPRRLLVLSTPLPGLPPELQKEVPTIDLPLPGIEPGANSGGSIAGRKLRLIAAVKEVVPRNRPKAACEELKGKMRRTQRFRASNYRRSLE